jgi:hypothetical protein
VTAFVPPGWPTGVQPPGSPEFERSAVAWLLEVLPSDYLLHGVLRRHPIALGSLARHHLTACVEGARNGYRTARSELGPHLPPGAVEAVLTVYRSEGKRLAHAARAADLIERALHGEVFVPQMSGGARSAPPPPLGSARNKGSANRVRTPDRSPGAGAPGRRPAQGQPAQPRSAQPRSAPARSQPSSSTRPRSAESRSPSRRRSGPT